MYLGWSDADRRKQLEALQSLIAGYALALQDHRVGNDDIAVLAEFEAFLRQRSNADNFSGIDQILATSETEQAAWARLWALVDEFRSIKSHTLSPE